MDLVVYTNGTLRNISGVDESTTCAQVVYALAHATNQKGRFVLVAILKNQNKEHRLMPNEKPYALVKEYNQQGAEVAFELRKVQAHPDGGIVKEGAEHHLHKCEGNQHGISSQFSNNDLTSSSSSLGSAASVEEIRQLTSQCRDEGQFTPTLSTTSSVTTLQGFELNEGNPNRRERRPPPPDYNKVIEQRCSSLTRRPQGTAEKVVGNLDSNDSSSGSIHLKSAGDLYEKRFTREELEALVAAQRRTIENQRHKFLELELALSDDSQRELVQLKKQHNNLQTVLNSLRNANWPRIVETERRESERLHTAIDAMKTAIENKQRELQEMLETQQTLKLQMAFEESQRDVAFENALETFNNYAIQQRL